MQGQFNNLNIIISGVEETADRIKIKDQNNKSYSFFKNKKEGGNTQAFEQFQQYKVGEEVGISIKEVPFKDGIIRNIIRFQPVLSQQIIAKNPPPKVVAPIPDKNEDFWDKKALKQSEWLYFIHVNNGNPLTKEQLTLVKEEFEKIHKFVENGDIPINVDDIPF